MTGDLDTVKRWALRKGYPLNPDGSLPQSLIDRYRKARAYAIRRTYAQRNARGR